MMSTFEQHEPLDDAAWVNLTDDLLASSEADRWCALVDGFRPVDHPAGDTMATWLRDCVHERQMLAQTRALRNAELLGFYGVEPAEVYLSDRGGAIFEVTRRLRLTAPTKGLMLASIVRSRETKRGFGQVLLEDVLGLALEDPEIEGIFIEPATPRVGEMWQKNYHFQPVDVPRRPGLLYLPVTAEPEPLED